VNTSSRKPASSASLASTRIPEDEEAQSYDPNASRPVVDPVKGRYAAAHSSIVLPRRMSQSMHLSTELRFHSYGWNINIRPESAPAVSATIVRLLAFPDLTHYSDIYFEVVDPVFQFIDRTRYYERCSRFWSSQSSVPKDFEALVAGVVALGSFFAENSSPQEGQMVEHTKTILDLGCAYAPGRLSLDQTAAWILRTLYLRLTTRPHLAWYASCSTMHVVEAQGLHVDFRHVDVVVSDSPAPTIEFLTARRKLFDCASFLNATISADYGRSRVVLQDASALNQPGSSRTPFLELTRLLTQLESGMLEHHERLDILSSIKSLPDEPPVFVLLKTDVAIHMFRRHMGLTAEKQTRLHENKVMLSIIKDALSEVRHLLPRRQPWWNILFTPFQAFMVLLVMDSDDSLALVSETLSLLKAVYEAFPTYLAGEVWQTAQTLAKGLEKQKRDQARFLSNFFELMPDSGDGGAAASVGVCPGAAVPGTGNSDPLLSDAANGGPGSNCNANGRMPPPQQTSGEAEALFGSFFRGDVDWMSLWAEASVAPPKSNADLLNFP
jgi:hypothetical protein